MRKGLDEYQQITWSHGGGAKITQDLVVKHFAPAFTNSLFTTVEDAATIVLDKESNLRLAFSSDTYAMSPLFFPGGDIGKVAVNGTINDLATAGAKGICLSASFILEVGFPIAVLDEIVKSMAKAAKIAEVPIVTGDTKVVEHIVVKEGKDDITTMLAESKEMQMHGEKRYEMLINTSGIGIVSSLWQGSTAPQAGDHLLLSGPIGDHGVATMLALHEFQEGHEVKSDSKSLYPLVDELLKKVGDGIRCFKHPTRGGLSMALHEIASRWNVGIEIDQEITARRANPDVRTLCHDLGLNFMEIPNEGVLLVVVSSEKKRQALDIMNMTRYGSKATDIGCILPGEGAKVIDKAGSEIAIPLGRAIPSSCGL